MTIKEFLDLFAQENGSIKRAAAVLGVSETYYHMMYDEDKSLRADRFVRMLEVSVTVTIWSRYLRGRT